MLRSAADGAPPLALNAWLRYDVVSRMLRPVEPSASVLEIGAGQGAVGARLACRFDYTGLEQDEESYALARERLAHLGRGRILAGTEDDLPARDGGFDVLCAFEVLEHIEDDFATLRRWHALLNPGGLIVLSTPAHQHRFGPWDEVVGHYRRYSRADLGSRLTATGFASVDVHSYGFPLGYALETARNVLARRRHDPGSMDARTAGSGRALQPGRRLGALMWAAALPFRLLQRPFARTDLGTGVVARARKPE